MNRPPLSLDPGALEQRKPFAPRGDRPGHVSEVEEDRAAIDVDAAELARVVDARERGRLVEVVAHLRVLARVRQSDRTGDERRCLRPRAPTLSASAIAFSASSTDSCC